MGVPYYGDFAEDDTVNIPFNTFTSNDPAASSTITDLADADIKVHKDGHIDEIVTDGATVVIDFDGVTGNHLITIDTSVHADYATGSEYQVRIEGTTVDAGTINAWVGSFSIERAGGVLAMLKSATYGLSVLEGFVDCLPATLNNLSAQNVRDAMKLNCTGNSPAAGSIDKHLDDIPADVLGATIDEATVGNNPTTLKGKIQAIFNRLFAKRTAKEDLETAYEKDDATVMETWDLADDDVTSSRTR